MSTSKMPSTIILKTTEAEILPKIQGFRALGLNFQETFRDRVESLLLKNTNPDIQKTTLVRQRGGIISIQEEGRYREELPPERGNFDAVLKEYTERNALNPRPLIRVGFSWVKDQIDYILKQDGLDNIELSFETWTRMNGRRIPPYLQITAPQEVQLDAIVKHFRLEKKKQIRGGDIQELFKHYYPNEPVKK